MKSSVMLTVDVCPICDDAREATDDKGKCPGCGARPRTKAIAPVLASIFASHSKSLPALPLLVFAMTAAERKLLAAHIREFKSVSLFGEYGGKAHESGVDVRDLSRFSPQSFCGVFASLLFDYFVEHEKALRECRRVTAPGGVLLTHVSSNRLLPGREPPRETRRKTSGMGGWMRKVPEDGVASVKVGREWLLRAMQDAGFESSAVDVHDRSSGRTSTWFAGFAR